MKIKGFTLLEAILGLVILAAVLIPFYGFVGGSFKSLVKTSDKIEKIAATEHVIAFLKTINPQEEPQGTMDFGLFNIDFQSTELLKPVTAFIQPPLPADNPSGASMPPPLAKSPLLSPSKKGADISLYQVHVRVKKQDVDWFEFDIRKIGYSAPEKPKIVLEGASAPEKPVEVLG